MNVAVIGGTGGMGRTLIDYFHSHNIAARPVGRKTKNGELIINTSEVIVISVPSRYLSKTVDNLSLLDMSGKLIIGLGSVMIHDEKILKKLLIKPKKSNTPPKSKKPTTLLQIHQLFGPQVFPFSKQKIAISGSTAHPFAKTFLTFLKNDGVTLIKLIPDQHDKIMAPIQALSQFSTINLAKTLSESGFPEKKLLETSTVTFKMNGEIMKRISAQKAELWAFLQFENKFALPLLQKHLKNTQVLLKMAQKKDYKGFETAFNKITKFWK